MFFNIYIEKEDKEEIMQVEKKIDQVYNLSDREILFPIKKMQEYGGILPYLDQISEIRIRANQPIIFYIKGKESYLTKEGIISSEGKNCKIASYEEIRELLQFWCQNSRYAYEDQIKKGFLTLKKGHRVGLCGEVVLKEHKEVQTIKYISSLNIRIAHEVKGVCDPFLPYIYENNQVKNILILSSPGAGKTTLLRDLIRRISQGNPWGKGRNISLIDERKEIAACYQGIVQLDVGPRTDVMDGCPKLCGMEMVLRTMGPSVIAVDEIGEKEEIQLMKEMLKCGCAIITTIHAASLEEFFEKNRYEILQKERIFDLFIELTKKEDGFHGRILEKGKQEICWLY